MRWGGFILNYFAIIHTRGKRGQETRLDSFYFGSSLFECVVVRRIPADVRWSPGEPQNYYVKDSFTLWVFPLVDCVQQVHFPPHRGAPDPGGGEGG